MEPHPGDLLSFCDIRKNLVNLQLGEFKLILDIPIKYTHEGYIAYFTPQKNIVEKLTQHLKNMKYDKEIVAFKI